MIVGLSASRPTRIMVPRVAIRLCPRRTLEIDLSYLNTDTIFRCRRHAGGAKSRHTLHQGNRILAGKCTDGTWCGPIQSGFSSATFRIHPRAWHHLRIRVHMPCRQPAGDRALCRRGGPNVAGNLRCPASIGKSSDLFAFAEAVRGNGHRAQVDGMRPQPSHGGEECVVA